MIPLTYRPPALLLPLSCTNRKKGIARKGKMDSRAELKLTGHLKDPSEDAISNGSWLFVR
jgi:hypothetical protein